MNVHYALETYHLESNSQYITIIIKYSDVIDAINDFLAKEILFFKRYEFH